MHAFSKNLNLWWIWRQIKTKLIKLKTLDQRKHSRKYLVLRKWDNGKWRNCGSKLSFRAPVPDSFSWIYSERRVSENHLPLFIQMLF